VNQIVDLLAHGSGAAGVGGQARDQHGTKVSRDDRLYEVVGVRLDGIPVGRHDFLRTGIILTQNDKCY